ncbi:hypothetical protein HMPREF0298_1815 [Corynebacterium lipophiloflavum DSM 44291]|uniref:Uncharacterized protein n=1 Tax=Corynebacterium lipophiloflavum (strain ATCC 700352 / DSM 44291 / CCUG 37336 / JCM 10383 / DMMZ 1944) TaxID=525263 RepID=C0XTP5_CORLD|nr:hypothetical protein HMPREF0298_1815 [Corynebacterium lipophiloflavum DSM 44291]
MTIGREDRGPDRRRCVEVYRRLLEIRGSIGAGLRPVQAAAEMRWTLDTTSVESGGK